jgi:RNA polymerase sigma-70 factor (ECF subfamily)
VSLGRDQHLAEDILQEVFIRVYRKLRWLREPEAFRAWTYQIASREAFRYLKREQRWSDQVRDEETLTTVPASDHESEFSREMIDSDRL